MHVVCMESYIFMRYGADSAVCCILRCLRCYRSVSSAEDVQIVNTSLMDVCRMGQRDMFRGQHSCAPGTAQPGPAGASANQHQ